MRIICTVFLLALVGSISPGQSGPFTFVFLNNNPNKPEMPKPQVDSLMAGHMANIGRLASEGKLLIAGPFFDGGGIFVLSTASRDTAWEWLKTDPGVRANRWIIEILPYVPRIGSVCTVGEPYQMVGYGFVRYSRTKNTDDNGSAEDQHLEYLRQVLPADSLVAEGLVGETGSILILRGEPDEDLLRQEPAVLSGELNLSVRKIWIARGSFCER